MSGIILVAFFLIVLIIIGRSETNENKIVKWLENQGYENIEIQYSTPLNNLLYNFKELFIAADFYDAKCKKNGHVEKKTIRIKFGSISEFDSNKVF